MVIQHFDLFINSHLNLKIKYAIFSHTCYKDTIKNNLPKQPLSKIAKYQYKLNIAD